MKSRPWIWIVVAFLLFVAGLGTMVTIAVRNPHDTVPISGELPGRGGDTSNGQHGQQGHGGQHGH